MRSTVCLLYANCIPVKGAKHSIICDLQRQNYIQIPNDLYDVLHLHKGKSIEEIKAYYQHQYDEIIDNYFRLLVENEYAFYTDTPELFPAMNLDWESPMEISNAIIDFDEQTDYNYKPALDQLSELFCKFIQFRYYYAAPLSEIKKVLEYLDDIQSNSIGIDIILPYSRQNSLEDFVDLFHRFKRVNTIVLSSSPHGKRIQSMGSSKYLIQIPTAITSEKCCGVVDKGMFSIHLQTFAEAQAHNTCLNGKISIDKRGMIRNCPSMPQSFGYVADVQLKEAIVDNRFKKYWNLGKDQIDGCKDCEFRYICTDCRAYTQDPDIDRSKPIKCGYDPYSGSWSDWSEHHLKPTKELATV